MSITEALNELVSAVSIRASNKICPECGQLLVDNYRRYVHHETCKYYDIERSVTRAEPLEAECLRLRKEIVRLKGTVQRDQWAERVKGKAGYRVALNAASYSTDELRSIASWVESD